MADEVRPGRDGVVDAEPELRDDAGHQRGAQQAERVRRQLIAPAPQQRDGEHEQQADDVLRHLLEGRQAGLRERGREDAPPEDARQQERVAGRVADDDEAQVQAPADHEGRGDEGRGQQEAGAEPELRRRVEGVRDHAQTGIVDQVHRVEDRHEHECDPQEDGEVVVEELAQRPGHDDHRHADDDERELRKGVEQQVGVQAREREQREEDGGDHGRAAVIACPSGIIQAGHVNHSRSWPQDCPVDAPAPLGPGDSLCGVG